jgi:hypothetical protein
VGRFPDLKNNADADWPQAGGYNKHGVNLL